MLKFGDAAILLFLVKLGERIGPALERTRIQCSAFDQSGMVDIPSWSCSGRLCDEAMNIPLILRV